MGGLKLDEAEVGTMPINQQGLSPWRGENQSSIEAGGYKRSRINLKVLQREETR